MSNSLSANTVFHLTSTFEKLESILINKFYASYSLEDVLIGTSSRDKDTWQYIPMVCFCDIPFSMVQKHYSNYGKYGIGLSKTWAKKNRINPVLYTYKGSEFLRKFSQSQKIINAYTRTLTRAQKEVIERDLKSTLLPTLQFVKPLKGHMVRVKKLVKFYDEKEWRYVPQGLRHMMVSKKKVSTGEMPSLNQLNKELRKKDEANLKFNILDIKFIILNRDSEIPHLVQIINRVFKKDRPADRLKLISKIITVQQMEDSF